MKSLIQAFFALFGYTLVPIKKEKVTRAPRKAKGTPSVNIHLPTVVQAKKLPTPEAIIARKTAEHIAAKSKPAEDDEL